MCYRKAKKYFQVREVGSLEQILAYDTETEFKKSRCMFILNLIEWFAFIIARTGYTIDFILEFDYEDHFNSSESTVKNAYFLIPGTGISKFPFSRLYSHLANSTYVMLKPNIL